MEETARSRKYIGRIVRGMNHEPKFFQTPFGNSRLLLLKPLEIGVEARV